MAESLEHLVCMSDVPFTATAAEVKELLSRQLGINPVFVEILARSRAHRFGAGQSIGKA